MLRRFLSADRLRKSIASRERHRAGSPAAGRESTTITADRRPVATRLAHHRWTTADVERMLGSGQLIETDRVEPIEGALIDMAPIGARHANLVDVIAQVLVRRLPAGCRVRVQNPIRLVDVAARRLSIHREPTEGD